MELLQVIEELLHIAAEHGNITTQLQNAPGPGEPVVGDESFFIVAEEYIDEDGNAEMVCNIRTWPY